MPKEIWWIVKSVPNFRIYKDNWPTRHGIFSLFVINFDGFQNISKFQGTTGLKLLDVYSEIYYIDHNI